MVHLAHQVYSWKLGKERSRCLPLPWAATPLWCSIQLRSTLLSSPRCPPKQGENLTGLSSDAQIMEGTGQAQAGSSPSTPWRLTGFHMSPALCEAPEGDVSLSGVCEKPQEKAQVSSRACWAAQLPVRSLCAGLCEGAGQWGGGKAVCSEVSGRASCIGALWSKATSLPEPCGRSLRGLRVRSLWKVHQCGFCGGPHTTSMKGLRVPCDASAVNENDLGVGGLLVSPLWKVVELCGEGEVSTCRQREVSRKSLC